MKFPFTIDQFTDAITKAVEQRGADYVYPDEWKFGEGKTCVYSLEDGTPACIIGQALYNIDPALMPTFEESMATIAGADAETVLIRLVARLNSDEDWTSRNDEGDYIYPPDELQEAWSGLFWAASSAQEAQDTGESWGEALDRYLSRLEPAS